MVYTGRTQNLGRWSTDHTGYRGFIEVRKNIDIARTDGGSHLYMADNKETRYIDCKDVELPLADFFINDVNNRTSTAMSQEHCFLATQMALEAQMMAKKLVVDK